MRWSCSVYLSACVLILLVVNFLLQLTALTTARWAHFSARIDLGKPREEGHFGLWTLCSVKAPLWVEDCDSLDTFFEAPPFIQIGGILAVVHLLLLMLLLPLCTIRILQLIRNKQDIVVKSKIICVTKVVIAFISVIVSILVAILASLGENRLSEYTVTKDWSFWIQIAIIVFNVIATLLCATENFRFWQQHIRENADPYGQRSETYGNPAFDSGSPEVSRRRPPPPLESQQSGNGAIAVTMASGDPSIFPPERVISQTTSSSQRKLSSKLLGKSSRQQMDTTIGTLTFENTTFQENSPTANRSRH